MFESREDAANKLVEKIKASKYDFSNNLIVGLARGGVVLASILSEKLRIPFDILSVKKIGFPANPELAIGAVTEFGSTYINGPIKNMSGLSDLELDVVINNLKDKAKKKSDYFRFGNDFFNVEDKEVIIVDDGVATGATILACISQLKAFNVSKIIVAIPVAPREIVEKIKIEVDEIFFLSTPSPFDSVGKWYEHFEQVRDTEVREIYESLYLYKNQIHEVLTIEDISIDVFKKHADYPRATILLLGNKIQFDFIHKLNEQNFSTVFFDFKKNVKSTTNEFSKILILALNWLVYSEYFDPLIPLVVYCDQNYSEATLKVAADPEKKLSILAIIAVDPIFTEMKQRELRNIESAVLILCREKESDTIKLNKKINAQLKNSKLILLKDNNNLNESIIGHLVSWIMNTLEKIPMDLINKRYYVEVSDELQ